jgi:hypothetical protein
MRSVCKEEVIMDLGDKPEAREAVLAQEGLAQGWTPPKVVRALQARIRRDIHYLTYRRLKGYHTAIDREIEADLVPLAVAVYYLEHGAPQEQVEMVQE